MTKEDFEKQEKIRKELSETVQRFSNLPLKSAEQAMKNARQVFDSIPKPLLDQIKRLVNSQNNLIKQFPNAQELKLGLPSPKVLIKSPGNLTIQLIKQNNHLIKVTNDIFEENKKIAPYNKRMFWIAIASLIVTGLSLIATLVMAL